MVGVIECFLYRSEKRRSFFRFFNQYQKRNDIEVEGERGLTLNPKHPHFVGSLENIFQSFNLAYLRLWH